MIPTPDKLVVRPIRKEEIDHHGIILSTTISEWFDVGGHITTGIVTGIPSKLTKGFVEAYGGENVIKIGDFVCFHYLAIDEDSFAYFGDEYVIDYNQVFYYIRDEEIYPLPGYYICDIIPEDPDDLKTSSGIITRATADHVPKQAVVRYCTENEMGIKVGDCLIVNLDQIIDIMIGENRYWRMRDRNMMAKAGWTYTEDEITARKQKAQDWNTGHHKIAKQKGWI